MIEIPKLDVLLHKGLIYIISENEQDLTYQQADEVIRRAEAYEGLREAVLNLRERMETIQQLSDMYMPLIGTKKECPWVRTMWSINVQAEQGRKETVEQPPQEASHE